MRQAGLKPKSHSSGVYWVRASATPGGKKSEAEPKTVEDTSMVDNVIAYTIVVLVIVWWLVS